MAGFGPTSSLPTADVPSGVLPTTVALALETDVAFDVTALRSYPLGLATEQDVALAATVKRSLVVGLATEQDIALAVSALKTEQWPFDDLKPRDIQIQLCSAPIGGGMSLTGREPTVDSDARYWRIVLGAIPVKTRTAILIWRALQLRFGGRARSILLHIYDGKRAPWVSTPGGPITATANAAVAKGSTSIAINASSAGELLVGQHFSAGHWLYRIKTISGPVANVYTCTIEPKTREAIASGASLEFRRPVVRCRQEDDNGMKLELYLNRFGEATVAFVEDVPPDV